MSGINQYLDRLTITLTDRAESDIRLQVDVYDNSLSRKWLDSLNHLIAHGYHLEKNYCFLGWDRSARNLEYLCEQINQSIFQINASALDYTIKDYFTPANTVQKGEVGDGLPGMRIAHEKFNNLHRYFEDLQGTSANPSPYYLQASEQTRWHIRQLNLLCHEAECFILSARKAVQAPDWRRPSQLMCWLNAPRFKLDDEDLQHFGLDKLAKPFGGVSIGVNKAVGKHHWEVFHDEGRDSRLDELTTTSLSSQTEASGDFDIEWGRTTTGHDFWTEQVNDFSNWLVNNGFDPHDPSLTLGYPQVAQVNLLETFSCADPDTVWNILSQHLDVKSIATSDASCEYDYHWKDVDYAEQQITALQKF